MKTYTLERKLFLPISIDAAWEFFSNPHNLKNITPPSMDFHVRSNPPDEMYAGMIIEYTVKTLLGVPVRWITEISHVRKPFFFVDEQRFGPYRFWHHQHRFVEAEGGVEMTDIVTYALPFGIIGSLVRHMIVKQRLQTIFSYRHDVLKKIFSSHHPLS